MSLEVKKILVPIDFSEYSKNALRYAHDFCKVFQSEIILIYVIEPIVFPPDFSLGQITIAAPDALELDKRAREELERLAEEERKDSISIRTMIKSGTPFLEIIETAKEEEIDLIIISTHGHTGMEHILFGSTSEKVVRKAPCPVLTLRDPLKGFDYKQAFAKEG